MPSMGEILVILVLALIFVGPERLPEAATKLGGLIRQFRRATNDLKSQFEAHTEIAQPLKEIRSALYDDVVRPVQAAGVAVRRAPVLRPALPAPTATGAAGGTPSGAAGDAFAAMPTLRPRSSGAADPAPAAMPAAEGPK